MNDHRRLIDPLAAAASLPGLEPVRPAVAGERPVPLAGHIQLWSSRWPQVGSRRGLRDPHRAPVDPRLDTFRALPVEEWASMLNPS